MSKSTISVRQITRGANRERILRAALTIISRNGVDKVTHRAVANAAGVSPGTTTYHFATREDMVREAFALYIADFEKALVETLTQKPLSSQTDIVKFLTAMTSLHPDEGTLASTEYEMVLFAGRDHDMRLRVSAWARTLESWLSDPLEQLGAKRPLEAARLLVALCRGTEFDVLSRRKPMSVDAFANRLRVFLEVILVQD